MGTIKRLCKYIPAQCMPPGYASYDVHPALKTGIDCLNLYSHWVSVVVMPIAFQWIEEHHDDVYGHLNKRSKKDVGAVIASAFEWIRAHSEYYKEGLAYGHDIEEAKERGNFDPTEFNPIWTDMSNEIENEIRRIFHKRRDALKSTVDRTPAPGVPERKRPPRVPEGKRPPR